MTSSIKPPRATRRWSQPPGLIWRSKAALIETAPDTFHAVEIKSGETIASDFFSGLDYWRAKLPRQTITPWLVHGGTSCQQREKATVLPWNGLSPLIENIV
jgi:hypothetical protein